MRSAMFIKSSFTNSLSRILFSFLLFSLTGCSVPVSDNEHTADNDGQAALAPQWADMVLATLQHDDRQREYYFYDPQIGSSRGETEKEKRALIIVLHGGGSHARNVMQRSAMATIAQRAGFIVAFPNGVAAGPIGMFRTWNAGTCCNPAMKKEIDDVGFIRALIRTMIRSHDVDAKRVFVTGFSNGGLLSYQLACELSESIAAVAPVAAVLPDSASCTPSRMTPLIAFHGRKDNRVLYAGNTRRDGITRPSVPDSLDFWGNLNGCRGSNEIRFDGYQIGRYVGCDADVMLYSIDELGHRWPGWDRRLWTGRRDPKTSLSVDASAVMWEFFDRLPIR